jgi:Holliday junction resolvasome RuvABC endonuclease subunit
MGIDQSLTSTGYTILGHDRELLTFGCIGSQKDHHVFDRALSIALQLNSLCVKYKVQYVAMEGLPFNAMSNVTRDLAGLMFTVGTHLVDYTPNESLFVYPPTKIKKWATESGKATKDMMVEALPEDVRTQFKFNHTKSKGLYDLADAYFINTLLRSEVGTAWD